MCRVTATVSGCGGLSSHPPWWLSSGVSSSSSCGGPSNTCGPCAATVMPKRRYVTRSSVTSTPYQLECSVFNFLNVLRVWFDWMTLVHHKSDWFNSKCDDYYYNYFIFRNSVCWLDTKVCFQVVKFNNWPNYCISFYPVTSLDLPYSLPSAL